MKKLFFYSIIFILLSAILFALNSAAAAIQDVIINEIAWMGTKANSSDEWIELKNNTSSEIDLAGWKLYEKGGETLIIALTKKIAPNGYYLIERTDNNTVSDVTADDFGSFGGSGLSNSGEYLTLKDSAGNIVDSLDFSGNWPAGNTSPDYSSMEKDSGGWHTNNEIIKNGTDADGNPIRGTPRAQNSNSTSQQTGQTTTQSTTDSSQQTTDSNNQTADTANNSSAETTENTISNSPTSNFQLPTSIQANAGENIIALASQEITFDASKSQGNGLSYEWNFGDGSTAKEKISKHKYNFAGKYIVILTVSDGQNQAQSQITASIYPPGVYINEFIPSPAGSDDNEWIEIYNSNDFPVDISGWTIGDNSKKSFSFPQNTLIAKQSYLVISRETTKIALNNNADALKFYYPENILIEEINYKKAKEGYSASRKQSGNFIWTKNISPSAPNIFLSESVSYQNNAKQNLIVSADPRTEKVVNLINGKQKYTVIKSGESIIKNLISGANAQTVNEDAKENESVTSDQSIENNQAPLENKNNPANMSANISNAINNINKSMIIKIFLTLATFGIFAMMWRVMRNKNQ